MPPAPPRRLWYPSRDAEPGNGFGIRRRCIQNKSSGVTLTPASSRMEVYLQAMKERNNIDDDDASLLYYRIQLLDKFPSSQNRISRPVAGSTPVVVDTFRPIAERHLNPPALPPLSAPSPKTT